MDSIQFRPANFQGFKPSTYVIGWIVDGGCQEVTLESNPQPVMNPVRNRAGDQVKLTYLGFSVRVVNILESARITDVDTLLDNKVKDVLKRRGCGDTVTKEVFSVLHSKLGLELVESYKTMSLKELREVDKTFREILKVKV